MAVEPRRGCGYRKVGGIYLVCDGLAQSCDRLPFALTVCPTCSCGIKQARGWTWVDAKALFGGDHLPDCSESVYQVCPVCDCEAVTGKSGLLWIGEQFYPDPSSYLKEVAELGLSRRIRAVPRDFKLGETWVLLAHPKAITNTVMQAATTSLGWKYEQAPGIFYVFRPSRIEKIVTEKQSQNQEEMEALTKRGITPVVVPDDDRDHQGSVLESPSPKLGLEEQ